MLFFVFEIIYQRLILHHRSKKKFPVLNVDKNITKKRTPLQLLIKKRVSFRDLAHKAAFKKAEKRFANAKSRSFLRHVMNVVDSGCFGFF